MDGDRMGWTRRRDDRFSWERGRVECNALAGYARALASGHVDCVAKPASPKNGITVGKRRGNNGERLSRGRGTKE